METHVVSFYEAKLISTLQKIKWEIRFKCKEIEILMQNFFVHYYTLLKLVIIFIWN